MKIKRKRKKLIAFLIFILLIATLVLALTYIVLESDHDCAGTNCTVCNHIHMLERFIGYLGITLAILFRISSASEAFNKAPLFITPVAIVLTPVAQNIRMNN